MTESSHTLPPTKQLEAPYEYNQELTMARVSRIAARSKGKQSRTPSTHSDFYPSINSLRSEQALEGERPTCAEYCMAGLKYLYNFTIASCECISCCLSKSSRVDLGNGNGNDTDTDTIQDEEIRRMKDKLTFHFMNPFQKWKYPQKRRFPWKLLVQLASIFLVTLQLVIFARTKFSLTNFVSENQSTFTKLFIQGPNAPDGDDPLPTPISVLYTHEELQNQVEFTIQQYFSLDSVALGSYGYGWRSKDNPDSSPFIRLTIEKYNSSNINPAAKIYKVSKNKIKYVEFINSSEHTLNWTKIRKELSQTIQFTLQFNISTILAEGDNPTNSECFQFHVELLINNDMVSGNMPIRLKVTPEITDCDNDTDPLSGQNGLLSNTGTVVLDVVVIISAVISIGQCLRSLVTSWILTHEVKALFLRKFGYRLKYYQILPLYNMWFLGVIISNLLVLLGCTMKFLISYSIINNDNLELVDITSIIIGLSVFGQWCGLLRFLSYFDKYNMLLITLRLSLPSVIRFVICTGILYIAFLLCGWLVLGPYHPKFRDPYVTSECLFSLINGDDMFATYSGMSQESTAAYIFSKIYLYIFIALFIYVVLSVFISLISDTYETLHEHWYERSKGLLVDFASGKLGQAHYGSGRSHSQTDLVINDPKEEEDYEYIREASNRFVADEQPLIPELNKGTLQHPPPPPQDHLLLPDRYREHGGTRRNHHHGHVHLDWRIGGGDETSSPT